MDWLPAFFLFLLLLLFPSSFWLFAKAFWLKAFFLLGKAKKKEDKDNNEEEQKAGEQLIKELI